MTANAVKTKLQDIQSLRRLFVQEVRKACYLAGRVPAARCQLQNQASRATLIKAGLKVCGFMLMGRINPGRRAS